MFYTKVKLSKLLDLRYPTRFINGPFTRGIKAHLWSVKSYISLRPGPGFRNPLSSGLVAQFCQWRSQWGSLGCGGTHTFPSRRSSVCQKRNARMLWISPESSHTWSREGTQTHSRCCIGTLLTPNWTMVALCIAQHRIPIYDNRAASTSLD